MSWLNILGVALALAMDAFAVAVAAGLSIPRLTGRHVFRLAWHFGLFQALMPVLGWAAGRTVAESVAAWDHWVAFGLLSLLGGKMLFEAVTHKEERAFARADPTRGWSLVLLSLATSLDALAAGLSMAMLNVSVWLPSVVIGLVAGGLTLAGIRFGNRIGRRFEHWAEGLGGAVLIAIGLRVLLGHLLA